MFDNLFLMTLTLFQFRIQFIKTRSFHSYMLLKLLTVGPHPRNLSPLQGPISITINSHNKIPFSSLDHFNLL